jgi:hypothetical protein
VSILREVGIPLRSAFAKKDARYGCLLASCGGKL